MKLIYTKYGAEKPNVDGAYRNADYFDTPERLVDEVVIFGEYPEIQAAYEDLGIPVTVEDDKPKQEQEQTKKPTVEELRAFLTEKGIEYPEDAKKAELFALYEQALAGQKDGD